MQDDEEEEEIALHGGWGAPPREVRLQDIVNLIDAGARDNNNNNNNNLWRHRGRHAGGEA